MTRPAVCLPLICLLCLSHPAARAEFIVADGSTASAWYAVLIVVFAVAVVIGLLGSRRDDAEDPPGPAPKNGINKESPR